MPPPRYLSRRPPFRLALVGLVVLLTGLTGAAIGGLAWLAAQVSSIASVGPARLERVNGLTEPADIHRLLDVRLPADEAGDALTPAAEAARA